MTATAAEVKRAVDAALGVVRERAGEGESRGRLADEVVAALRGTGLNRLALPAALGGLQAPVVDTMEVVERIAAADGSTAWCAVIGVGSNLFAGYIPEAGARVAFADPDQGNATMFAPAGRIVRTGGQARLTGRWPFTSNCLHSAWVGLGALVEEEDGSVGSVPRVVFVPAADLTVEDTWDSAGLRATGSHHTAAEGLVVDLDRSCTFSDRPWPEGTLWRLPLYIASLPMLASVPLGIARGALDEIGRQAREGRTARRGQLADDPLALAELALADSRLRAARAGLREVVEEAHALAGRGEAVGRQLQARAFLASLLATDVGVEATSVAHQLGGGAAAYAGSPLLRALCDADAARQHLLLSAKHRPELGKITAGLDVVYPPFVT